MDNTPNEAPAAAQAAESEATPNTNPTPAAPDMHGFTSEELADMRKFFDSQGGYTKVKSKISNPDKYVAEQKTVEQPQPHSIDEIKSTR